MKKVGNWIDSVTKSNRVYIVPTKQGFTFLLVVVAIGFIGVIYQNNLTLIFSFILTSIFFLSMFATNHNLTKLVLTNFELDNNFATLGNRVKICLLNIDKRSRFSINLLFKKNKKIMFDKFVNTLEANEVSIVEEVLNISTRGSFHFDQLQMVTTFPFGFFKSWINFNLDHHFFVYPKPTSLNINLEAIGSNDEGEIGNLLKEGVEFTEHRQVENFYDNRHIDWKVWARSGQKFVKKFNDTSGPMPYIDLKKMISEIGLLPALEYTSFIIKDVKNVVVLIEGQKIEVNDQKSAEVVLSLLATI